MNYFHQLVLLHERVLLLDRQRLLVLLLYSAVDKSQEKVEPSGKRCLIQFVDEQLEVANFHDLKKMRVLTYAILKAVLRQLIAYLHFRSVPVDRLIIVDLLTELVHHVLRKILENLVHIVRRD